MGKKDRKKAMRERKKESKTGKKDRKKAMRERKKERKQNG